MNIKPLYILGKIMKGKERNDGKGTQDRKERIRKGRNKGGKGKKERKEETGMGKEEGNEWKWKEKEGKLKRKM